MRVMKAHSFKTGGAHLHLSLCWRSRARSRAWWHPTELVVRWYNKGIAVNARIHAAPRFLSIAGPWLRHVRFWGYVVPEP